MSYHLIDNSFDETTDDDTYINQFEEYGTLTLDNNSNNIKAISASFPPPPTIQK